MNKMTLAAGAAIMAVTASLASCSREDAPKAQDREVKVEASVLSTKGFYAPNDLPEEFSISIKNPGSEDYSYGNVKVTKGENVSWITARKMLWQDYEQKVDIIAFCPYNQDYAYDVFEDNHYPVSVEADQSEISSYNRTHDFLVYKRTGYAPQEDLSTRGTINVEFSHALTWMRLYINFGTEYDYPDKLDRNAVTDLSIEGTITNGYCDFTANPLPKVNVVEGTAQTPVKPYMVYLNPASGNEVGETKSAQASYQVMLLPQTVEAGKFAVYFKLRGRTFSWEAANEVKLEEGKYYNLTLNVGKDRIVAGSISANPWEDGESFDKETE